MNIRKDRASAIIIATQRTELVYMNSIPTDEKLHQFLYTSQCILTIH